MDKEGLIQDSEIKIIVEDSNNESARAEQVLGGEDTPKNETSTPALSGQDVRNSAGVIANALGNEKKVAYENLVALAKESDIAKKHLQGMMESDNDIDKYVKAKFPVDYSLIKSNEAVTPKSDVGAGVDLNKIREEERIRAKAELLTEQIAEANNATIQDKGFKLGFNVEEMEKFKGYVNVLGIDAIDNAALLVNQEKANANRSFNTPGTITTPSDTQPKVDQVVLPKGIVNYAEMTGQNLQEIAKQKMDIDKNTVNGVFYLKGISN